MLESLSVLVPTRHRIERLKTLLTSYELTTTGANNVELVFRVDDDDPETRHFLLDRKERVLTGSRLGGYQSMPVFFNELANVASGDVLMCGNDDMVFKTYHWPTLILQEANGYSDGIFNIGVSTLNESHFPFSTVSRKVVDCLGFIWDPRIFWGDIYLRDVMAWFGRNVMLPTVQIDHDWAGYRPDKVFQESDKNITYRDPTYWTGTHAQAVSDAVNRLHELYRK